MGRNYLTEAFKEMELLESKSFGLDKQGLEGLDSFLDTDELKDIETYPGKIFKKYINF